MVWNCLQFLKTPGRETKPHRQKGHYCVYAFTEEFFNNLYDIDHFSLRHTQETLYDASFPIGESLCSLNQHLSSAVSFKGLSLDKGEKEVTPRNTPELSQQHWQERLLLSASPCVLTIASENSNPHPWSPEKSDAARESKPGEVGTRKLVGHGSWWEGVGEERQKEKE